MIPPPRPFAPDAPILLWGPPAVGKSTVGAAAAARLGVPFEDLDDVVARRLGRPISEIFERDGEEAFRRAEREALLALLAAPGRRLCALGGGTLVDPWLRRAALERAVVVGLSAPVSTLVSRARSGGSSRPLLVAGGTDASGSEARLRSLLEGRAGAYGERHVAISAARAPLLVAADVARAARDRYAWVSSAAGGHPVRLGEDAALGAADAAFGIGPTRFFVVSDEAVARTWGGAVSAALAALGQPTGGALTFPAGEQHKRLATLERLAEGLVAAGADRGSCLVAVGGGVTSDLTGLLAALQFRGLPWIGVPTTLLAMVDAAVGGKTGVDLAGAKNVLGAFHPPRAVIVDPAHGETEPLRQLRAGLAEAVKTALVGDPELLAILEALAARGAPLDDGPDSRARGALRELREEIVARCLAVKIGVVARDEHERGERAHLNLGHTFGHALEAAAGLGTLLHGEAVAIGLVAALRVGEDRGVTEAGLSARIEDLLGKLGLPVRAPRALCAQAVARVGADKKRSGARIRFVAVEAPGRPRVLDEETAPLAEALARAASA